MGQHGQFRSGEGPISPEGTHKQLITLPDNGRLSLNVCLNETMASISYVPNSIGESPLDEGRYLRSRNQRVFAGLPGLHVLRIRNSPAVTTDTHHVSSNSGIASIIGPVSNFVDWSFARKADENRRYLVINFKQGSPFLLPKRQLNETELTTIRAIVRTHLKKAAKLW